MSQDATQIVHAIDRNGAAIVAASGGGGAGSATAANQVTGNTSLASIDSKAPALVAGKIPVDASGTNLTVVQPTGTNLHTVVDSGTITANAGTNLNTSALALETGGNLATIATNTNKIPALGQTTMSASAPVAIASNQSAIPTFISDPTSLTKATVSAAGALSVGLPATTVFNDSLNGTVIDITNRWNAPVLAGTGTVTQNGTSGLIFTNGTTANNAGQISSQPTFDISGAIQYIFALGIQLEATTITTGNHRFYGLANQGTSYSTSNPIKEGVGFEITTTGILRAVIYSADVVTFSQNITIPLDGAEHLYGVFFLGNYIFWYIDQFSIPVAVSGLLQPSNTVLPIRLHSLNGGSTTVSTPIFNAFSMAIVDSTRNGINITDGTYGWRKATVSASGELSVKSSGIPTSLGQKTMANSQAVTIASDQSTLPVQQQDSITTGTITTQNLNPLTGIPTVGSFVGFSNINSTGTLTIQVTGTYTATSGLSIQGSLDGATWVTYNAANTGLQDWSNFNSISSSITSAAVGIYKVNTANMPYVRISALGAVTGTANILLRLSNTLSSITVNSLPALSTGANTIGAVNIAAAQTLATVTTLTTLTGTTTLTPGTGATNLGKAEDAAHVSGDTGVASLGVRTDTLLVGTSANGDYGYLATDKYNSVLIKDQTRHKVTYSLAFTVTLAATPTDVFQIIGSATKSVLIHKINISGSQTTGGTATVSISKRSAANTGGTSSASIMIPHDSADAGATAVGSIYTANPTPGAAVGNIRVFNLPLAAVTGTTNNIVELNFGERGKPIVLTGIAQALAINLGGATLTGGSLNVWIEFTEE